MFGAPSAALGTCVETLDRRAKHVRRHEQEHNTKAVRIGFVIDGVAQEPGSGKLGGSVFQGGRSAAEDAAPSSRLRRLSHPLCAAIRVLALLLFACEIRPSV